MRGEVQIWTDSSIHVDSRLDCPRDSQITRCAWAVPFHHLHRRTPDTKAQGHGPLIKSAQRAHIRCDQIRSADEISAQGLSFPQFGRKLRKEEFENQNIWRSEVLAKLWKNPY